MENKSERDILGTATAFLISYACSDTFTFEPGVYTVEMYVDYHLTGRGSFVIAE